MRAVPGPARRAARVAGRHPGGLPSDPAGVWEKLRAALSTPGVPQNGIGILTAAITAPCWHGITPAAHYGGLRALREPPPWWFPAAWYHFLRASPDTAGEAARWLAWLDRLAEEPPARDWRPAHTLEDGAAHLALAHIQAYAGPIADACRAWTLPGGAWPTWRDGAWPYPVPLAAFPPAFAAAWNRLFRRPPRMSAVCRYSPRESPLSARCVGSWAAPQPPRRQPSAVTGSGSAATLAPASHFPGGRGRSRSPVANFTG